MLGGILAEVLKKIIGRFTEGTAALEKFLAKLMIYMC